MESLRARGHEVRCIISSWAGDNFDERLKAKEIPFVRLPLGFLSKKFKRDAMRMTAETLSKSPHLWLAYRNLLKEYQPDVVLHSTMHHLLQLWPVLDARNTFFHVHDPFSPTPFYRRLFRLLSLRVRTFIGVSHYIEQSIIALGVPPEKVSSVLNGLTPQNPELTNEGNCKNSEGSVVRIGIVGQISQWKGHDDFIEALKELKRAGVQFSAAMFGAGADEYVAALTRKIELYKLSEQVQLAGFVNNQAAIFRSLDICVVPSRSQDPCPTVAIEAAHFGVPVIATKCGGLPELVLDGKTGYLIDAESPLQLAEKIKLLIEDVGLRRRMSESAKEFAARQLTGERMAEQMEAFFFRAIHTDS